MEETGETADEVREGSCTMTDTGHGGTRRGERHVFEERRFVVCWARDRGPAGVGWNQYRVTNLSGHAVDVGVVIEKLPDLHCKRIAKGGTARWTSEGVAPPFVAVGKPQGVRRC